MRLRSAVAISGSTGAQQRLRYGLGEFKPYRWHGRPGWNPAATLAGRRSRDRKTDNRSANLEAVTGSGNMLHAYQTGLTRPSRSNAKITPELALTIYRRCQAGERDTPLALEYGVNRSVVNNIRNGWTWAHVTGHKASGPRTAQEKRDANEARHAAMGGQGIDGR